MSNNKTTARRGKSCKRQEVGGDVFEWSILYRTSRLARQRIEYLPCQIALVVRRSG